MRHVVINEADQVVGVLTDGDIRRALWLVLQRAIRLKISMFASSHLSSQYKE